MEEARLEDSGSGLAPTSPGWFVVNLRDAMWVTTEGGKKKLTGSESVFESPHAELEQYGVRVHVLQPGEPNGLYHRENQQEDFLVLHGECMLLVEGEERPLRRWDFVHCPAWTEHIFVGAGDGPCAILMVGARKMPWEVVYPVSDVAAKHGASAEVETPDPDVAYTNHEPSRRARPSFWSQLPWA